MSINYDEAPNKLETCRGTASINFSSSTLFFFLSRGVSLHLASRILLRPFTFPLSRFPLTL
jgi:hypothetical protein